MDGRVSKPMWSLDASIVEDAKVSGFVEKRCMSEILLGFLRDRGDMGCRIGEGGGW